MRVLPLLVALTACASTGPSAAPPPAVLTTHWMVSANCPQDNGPSVFSVGRVDSVVVLSATQARWTMLLQSFWGRRDGTLFGVDTVSLVVTALPGRLVFGFPGRGIADSVGGNVWRGGTWCPLGSWTGNAAVVLYGVS